MRLLLSGIVCVVLFSCREYHSFDAPIPITGYRLSGKVTSANGIVLDNVQVTILYYFDKKSDTPSDTARIIISVPVKYMRVTVVTPDDELIKTLYAGYPPAGVFPRQHWNERNSSGGNVPGGKYYIRYEYDTVELKKTPWIVENTHTATTDLNGEFTLTNNELPVGELFDIYNVDDPGEFYGAYTVTSRVRLSFSKGSMNNREDITIEKNKLTRRVFTLQ